LDGPSTYKDVLANGLKILLRESHRSPVVELQIWAGVGSADERSGEEGLAHFHEHMLFKGTERRGVGEVAGDIEGLGGQINAYTSFDTTVYHATLPAAVWREGLDVLVDAVRFSTFVEQEVVREREVVLEEIRRSEDTPGHVLGDLAFRESYRSHPYGLPILGPASNVAGFDGEQVQRFFHRWYTPENLMVVAVGDFDSREVAREIARLFDDARPGEARRTRPAAAAPKSLRVKVLRKPFEGHRVDLCWPAARFQDSEAVHLDLLAYVLGECESSRLVRRIREREGLVDRIDAGAYTPLDRGLFSVSYETDAARLLEATTRIVEETERLRLEPVGEAELERARVNFLASEQFDRESVSGLASKLGNFEAVGGGWERESESIRILREATTQDLLRAAQRYLRPEALAIAVLIPESADPALDEAAIREATERGITCAEGASTGTPIARSATGAARHEPGREHEGARRHSDAERQSSSPSPIALQVPPGSDTSRFDARLPNGLRLHIQRRPEIPIAALRMAFRGGLLAETPETSGLTRFLGAMWTRGTKTLDATSFARESENLAAEIDGFSGRNSVGLTLDCLSETLEPAIDLFAEALLEPRLDPEEIERERRETLAALDRREDRLGQRAFMLFAEAEYQSHPYRMTVMGGHETVRSFTADDLRRHASSLIHAGEATLAIVGDVEPERIAGYLGDRIGDLPVGRGAATLPPAEPRGVGIRESALRKDRAQAHLVMGFRGLELDDPDRYALEAISQLLAGQGGRLFLELRDRHSLAYTVSASNVEGIAEGHFTIYIATAPDKLERARAGILEELEKLLSTPPSTEELTRAVHFGTGAFAIDGQRSHSRAAHMALDSLYGLGPDNAERYPAELARLTPEEVLRVARRVFRLDAYTLATVHP